MATTERPSTRLWAIKHLRHRIISQLSSKKLFTILTLEKDPFPMVAESLWKTMSYLEYDQRWAVVASKVSIARGCPSLPPPFAANRNSDSVHEPN